MSWFWILLLQIFAHLGAFSRPAFFNIIAFYGHGHFIAIYIYIYCNKMTILDLHKLRERVAANLEPMYFDWDSVTCHVLWIIQSCGHLCKVVPVIIHIYVLLEKKNAYCGYVNLVQYIWIVFLFVHFMSADHVLFTSSKKHLRSYSQTESEKASSFKP